MSARTILWSVLLLALGTAGLWLVLPASGADPSVDTAREGVAGAEPERAPGEATAMPATRVAPEAGPEEVDPSGLTGLVVRKEGTPVPGALVALREGGTALATTSASASGRFRFVEGVAGHTYLAGAEAPGHLPAEVPMVLGAPVRLVLERAGSLRGRVEDADQEPIARAQVLLQFEEQFPDWGRTSTDGRGQFALPLVPLRKSPTLWVLAPGCAPESRTLALKEPAEAWLDVTLGARVPITAEVRDLLTGTPIAGATVRGEAPVPIAASDAEGRFTLKATAGRPLSLLVGAEGRTWVEFKMMVEAADSAKVFPIRLPPGVTLSGVVRDASGRPLPGAQVALAPGWRKPQPGEAPPTPLPELPAFTRVPNVPDFRGTESGADGTFRLPGMLAGGGAVRVRASLPGYRAVLSEPVLLDPQRAAEPIVLTLRRGATVYGLVLLEGKPIAAEVMAWFEGKVGNAADRRTEEDGRYVLTDLPPGTVKLAARAASNQLLRESVEVQVAEGQVLAADLRIQNRVGFLAGRVTDEAGAPVADARVFLAEVRVEFAGFLPRQDALTAADGSWRIEQPWNPEAVYPVSCAHGSVVKQVRGVRQGTANVDFVLPVTNAVFLDVRDPGGSAARFWRCVVTWTNPATGASGKDTGMVMRQRLPAPGKSLPGLGPYLLPAGTLDLVLDLGAATFPVELRGVVISARDGPTSLPVLVSDATKVSLRVPAEEDLAKSVDFVLVPGEPDAPEWRRGRFGRFRGELALYGVPTGSWRVAGAPAGIEVECAPIQVRGEAELTVPIVLRRKR